MQRIALLSFWVRILILIVGGLHLLVLLLASGLLFSPDSDVFIEGSISVIDSWSGYAEALSKNGISLWYLMAPELLIYLIVYFLLFRLFGCYRQGEVFSASPIRIIQLLGRAMLLWPLFVLFYPLSLSFFLNMTGKVETLPIWLVISSSEIICLLAGCMLIVTANIMKLASDIKAEQELTI